jgi:uncharacterized protein
VTLVRRALVGGSTLLVSTALVIYWHVGNELCAPVRHSLPPAPTGLNARSVTFESDSGARLAAWLMAPAQPRGGIVLLHGIHADRRATLSRAALLWHDGFAVLAVDLQAHGASSGDVITFGYRESQDAITAVRFLRGQFPEMHVGAIGVSLGGASLALAGARLGADAVVLESAYSTIEDATRNRIAVRVGAAADVLTPILLLQLRPRIGVSADELRPVAHIGELRCPVLIASGIADPYTRYVETRHLYDAAPSPKELWLVRGAVHEDLYRYDPRGYRAHVLGFLNRYLRMTPAPEAHDLL